VGGSLSRRARAEPYGPALESSVVVLKQWVLLEAGSIGSGIEVGFDIDLSELDLRESFDGEHMGLRHTLGYRIVRPWYTFSVRGEEPIAIANCAPPANAPPPPDNTVIVVDDFGGVASFDHGKCTFAADGQLVGTVTFRNLEPVRTRCEARPLTAPRLPRRGRLCVRGLPAARP
jgi:hypothetical protein